MNSQSKDEINDFALQIMNEIDISDELDPSYFDGSFEEDAMNNVDFDLLMFEDSPEQDHPDDSDLPVAPSSSNEVLNGNDQGGYNHHHSDVVLDGSAFYDTQEYAVDGTTEQDDLSMSSASAPEEQQRIHGDLDTQIQNSMSKLVQSMHRSEISRNMLGRQQQSMGLFGIGSYLKGYSSIASGITQSKSQLNNYMSQVGGTSMM